MADQPSEDQQRAAAAYNPLNFLKAPFPAPPPFWKHFTTENLTRLAEHPEPSKTDDPAPKLPFDLAVLRPPPAPSAGEYRAFDSPNQVHPRADPPPQEILLFDPTDPRFNPAVMLTKLTKSLMLNFLELTTIVTEDPSERTEKIQAIRRLVINVHAVINMYRPHQARESVKEMLEGMLEDGEREMEECERVKGRVAEFLAEVEGLKKARDEGGGGATNGVHGVKEGVDENNEQVQEARRLWRLVHEIAEE